MTFLDRVHPEWLEAIANVAADVERIEHTLEGEEYLPHPAQVFRALEYPLSKVRVVIFGQDPYPTLSNAMGLAFSVPVGANPIPKTLGNIFRELHEDTGCNVPSSGDLTPWTDQGVALVNRILTVPRGGSGRHAKLNWQIVTNEIARILGDRGVVAILWGNHARELAPYFSSSLTISSPHPSPLSAYRGFFGSKPFSRTNQLLARESKRAIDWSLN